MAKPQIDLKFGADLKDFRRGMSNIDHSLRRLSGGFGALGGIIGASFAVDAIRQFTSEAIDLAAKAEGVEAAFKRMNDPMLLSQLRKATQGTISDLRLMQLAVDANNFRIPMDVFAKGLRFAQQRAVETGKSIDYLVESFVTGLGRESVKILDNLGFSTIELNAKTKELGNMSLAVGALMDEAFQGAGESLDTTSMAVERQRAEMENLKKEIGEGLLPVYNALLKAKLAFVRGVAQPFGEAFGVDEKTEQQLRNQLALLEKRQKDNEHNLKLYPKNITYQKNVTRLEEHRQQTLAALNALIGENTEEQKESTEATVEATEVVETNTEAIKKHNEAYFMAGESMREYIRLMNDMSQTAPMAFATVTQASEQFVTAGQKMQTAFMGVSDAIGNTLAQSFEAALMNGEGFFKTFIEGLKAMVAQLLATIAAAAVLALVLTLATGGLAGLSMQSFGTAFGQIGGGMGVPSFAMPGGLGGGGSSAIEIFGKLSGSDILLSGERASRNRSRSRGF